MSRPTRSTAAWAPTTPRFTRARRMRRTPRTRRARPGRIISCVRIDETYGLDTTVTNCSNNYGPYQFPEKLIPLDHHQHPRGQALAGLRRRAAGPRLAARRRSLRGDRARAHERAIRARSTTSAATARRRTSRSCARSARSSMRGSRRVLNCARRFPMRRPRRVRRAADLITHVRDRPGHDRRYAINFTKAKNELGYAPSRNLGSGLDETLEWYLAQQALVGDFARTGLCGLGREELSAMRVTRSSAIRDPRGCRDRNTHFTILGKRMR